MNPVLLAALAVSIGIAFSIPAAHTADRKEIPAGDPADARAALQSPAAETRRQGVVRLAKTGTMTDTQALAGVLRDADALNRALAEQAVWIVWSRSGDAKIDEQFAQGLELMNSGRHAAGIELFSAIISAKPDFAEGWNKRATLYFLTGDLQRSLADCDEVIKRNPLHFGALAGYGQIYAQMGELEKSLEYFRRALAVNPNMAGVLTNVEAIERLLEQRPKRAI